MDELNSRLEESESGVKVSDTWFRPNISVKDVSAPFVEDEWTYVKIGDGAVFRVNKLCGRCEYTNVDPETGAKIPRGEVLKVSAQTGFVPEVSFFACTKPGIKVYMWLREFSSCSCLTVLPGPAWLLLNKIFIPLFWDL